MDLETATPQFMHWLVSQKYLDLIKKYLDNDNFVCSIFIDLQKAFDTVNHDILLEKLDHYDIRRLANGCLGFPLQNRTHMFIWMAIAPLRSKLLAVFRKVQQ